MKDFDELLDSVLREDAAAEPRAGLETRVMAQVRGVSGQATRWRWLRLGWASVPIAACLGTVLLVQHLSFRRNDAPVSIAVIHRISTVQPETVAVKHTGKTRMEAVSVHRTAVRDRLHPIVKRSAEIGEVRLPKLDTFPASPARVAIFPRPVEANEELRLAALKSEKVAEALAKLKQEQNEPIRIAAIQITPLLK